MIELLLKEESQKSVYEKIIKFSKEWSEFLLKTKNISNFTDNTVDQLVKAKIEFELNLKEKFDESKETTNAKQKYTINAKKYYLSCINEDYIEKYGENNFINFINDFFGGWRLISPADNNSSKMENFFQIYEVSSFEMYENF